MKLILNKEGQIANIAQQIKQLHGKFNNAKVLQLFTYNKEQLTLAYKMSIEHRIEYNSTDLFLRFKFQDTSVLIFCITK